MKKDIGKKVLLSILVIAVSVVLLLFSYEAGRDKGRDETVKMIDDLASGYDFVIRQDGWTLGMGTDGAFYPGSSDSITANYNWDDYKIHLSYTDR